MSRIFLLPDLRRALSRYTAVAALLLLSLAGVLPAAAQSCTTTVSSNADSGAGSLRQAIAAVSAANPSGNVCISATGTINLNSTLSIPRGLSITGPPFNSSGANDLTISGQGQYQDVVITASTATRVIGVISRLNIVDSSGRGVIVQSGGQVYLANVGVENNLGGGIDNAGTLYLQYSDVSGNTTTQTSGAGIYNETNSTLSLLVCTVNSNNAGSSYGGGLENEGTVTIQGGAFSLNSAGQGAAIENGVLSFDTGATVTISGGTQFLNNSVVGVGGGGGIYNEFNYENYYQAYNVVSIAGSTFSGNTSKISSGTGTTSGGALYNADQMTVRESTLAKNTADGPGGAIFNSGTLTLVQDTVSGNTGSVGSGVEGGVEGETTTSVTLGNTIVAGNTRDDCDQCGTIAPGNLVGGTPMLGPLATNGGSAQTTGSGIPQTIMPLPGSPAIGGGVYTRTDSVDERGLSRTTVNGNTITIDTGAVQTHYNSVTFYSQPSASVTENQVLSPAVQVQVIEKDGETTNYPLGVPVTMKLVPTTGTLSGAVVVSPTTSSKGVVSAIFSDLSVNTPGSWQLLATTFPTTQNTQTAPYSSLSNDFAVTQPLVMTQTALGLSPNPPVSGQPETLTAAVTVSGTGTPVPSGSVAFTDDGTALSTVPVTNGVATLTGVQLGVGQHLLVASYTGNTTYGASGGGGTFTVKATPTVAIVTPPAILPGAALTAAMLHGTATINGVALAGSFSYSPALGTVLAAGSHTVTARFTPTDTTDYTTATGTGTFTVLAATGSLSSMSVSPATATTGTAETLVGQARTPDGVPGVVNGMMAFGPGSVGTAPLTLLGSGANFSQPGSSTSFNTYTQLVSYSADLNGDGVADQVFAADYEIGAIDVLFSDPAHPGSYLSQVTLGTYDDCTAVTGIAIGDVNGDGLPDIVAACQNSQDNSEGGPILLYLNQGNGSFSGFTTIGGQGPFLLQNTNVVLADFDGDRKLDLVSISNVCVTGGSACIAFQHGNGDGTFNSAIITSINTTSGTDTFANLQGLDLNGDGLADLAYFDVNTDNQGPAEIWLNHPAQPGTFGVNRDGTSCSVHNACFDPDQTIQFGPSGNSPSFLVTADLNGDGKTDLAAVTTDGYDGSGNTVSIALNSSSGNNLSFRAAVDTVYAGAQSLGIADFNQDGFADLALYSSTANTIQVYDGDGTGAFHNNLPGLHVAVSPPFYEDTRKPVTASRGPKGLRPDYTYSSFYPVFNIGDVNGDGFPDILYAQSGYYAATVQLALTSGASQAKLATTAPAQSTTYTGTTTPASKLWAGSTAAATLTVISQPTTTTLGVTPGAPTYGTAVTLTSKVVITATGTAASGGSVTFTEDGNVLGSPVAIDATGTATLSGLQPTGGQHVFGASYSGASGESPSTAGNSTIQVARYTPTLSWANPAQITTTTPLSGTQLNAEAKGLPGTTLELPGTYVYTPAAGTLLSAGTDTLSVTFTPTDTVDFTTASKTVQILVVKTSTQTALTIAPATSTYGQALTLTAHVTNTTGNTVVQGGSVTFTSENGTLSSVTVVSGVATLGGVLLSAGQHVIGASYTGTLGEFTSTAPAQTITVGKAAPVLTWPPPAAITTTTPLSGTQLDATAAGVNGTSLPGTFVYTPAAGATLPGGTQTLNVTFTPTDAVDYTAASTSVQIQVNATATRTTLTVSPAQQTTYGTPLTLTAHVSNTTGMTPVTTGTVTFIANTTVLQTVAVTNGIATLSGVTLPVGSPVLSAAYGSGIGEQTSTGTNTVTITKATPVITWPTPAAISSTTPLSAEQLDATAMGAGTTGLLPGTFMYTPTAGTLLTVGTHTLSTTFTPTDTDDYTTMTGTVQILVVNTNTRTTFTVTPGQPTYGQTVTLAAAVANTSGTGTVQSGSVVFTSDNVTLSTVAVVNGAASLTGVSLTGGQHLLSASYTGALGEGPSAAAAQTITVAKVTPVLTWATPAAITTTTPLSGTQLNATAAGLNGTALPGTFVYAPSAGTLLTVGTHTLSVTFTPTDGTNYGTATAQVSIQVSAQTITLTSVTPATTPIATTPLAVVLTGAGFPATSVVRVNGSAVSTTVISATQLGATIPAASLSKPGTLSLTIYDATSQALSNTVTLTVTAPTPVVMVTAPASVTSGDQPSLSIALATAYPVDLVGTLTLSFTPAGPNGVDDPAVQFKSGGRTLNFTIAAGTTAGPTTAIVAGTVEGTIAVATKLTANGVDVTPEDLLTPTEISVTPSAPTITGVAFSDVKGLLTVVVTGYSNTREMVDAQFTFTGPGEGDLSVPGVVLPATSLFGTWYGNEDSAPFGSTFVYTQTFQLSDPTTNITGATVTLTNTVGTSAGVNSQ